MIIQGSTVNPLDPMLAICHMYRNKLHLTNSRSNHSNTCSDCFPSSHVNQVFDICEVRVVYSSKFPYRMSKLTRPSLQYQIDCPITTHTTHN